VRSALRRFHPSRNFRSSTGFTLPLWIDIDDQVRSASGDAPMYIGKKKRFFVLAFFFFASLLLSAQQSPKDERSASGRVFRADTRLVVVDGIGKDRIITDCPSRLQS
jgi:hypothetical protein